MTVTDRLVKGWVYSLMDYTFNPKALRMTTFHKHTDMLTYVKLSFFDKFLSILFGAFNNMPYLCISINDK